MRSALHDLIICCSWRQQGSRARKQTQRPRTWEKPSAYRRCCAAPATTPAGRLIGWFPNQIHFSVPSTARTDTANSHI